MTALQILPKWPYWHFILLLQSTFWLINHCFSFCSVSVRKPVMQLQIMNPEQALSIYSMNTTVQCLHTVLFPVCILDTINNTATGCKTWARDVAVYTESSGQRMNYCIKTKNKTKNQSTHGLSVQDSLTVFWS